MGSPENVRVRKDQPTTQAAEIKNPKPATIQTTVSPTKDDSIDEQAPQKKDNGEQ